MSELEPFVGDGDSDDERVWVIDEDDSDENNYGRNGSEEASTEKESACYPTPASSLTQGLKRAADRTLHKDNCPSRRSRTDTEKSWSSRSPLSTVRINKN